VRVLSSTAATTWPTLVRTCSTAARDPRSSVVRDWTTMLCGATVMPVSGVLCSGPASVKASTFASAVWLPAFTRYSWMRARPCWPGPTNQKSVPGLSHRAAGMPSAPICSTSSPRAIDPLAWTTTPPCIVTVGTGRLPGVAVAA
jgi:hypothetical protein